jgi:hypothetical protein
VTAAVRLHYLFLVPWIVFGIPSQVLFGLQLPIAAIISGLGLLGMWGRREFAASGASVSLLVLVVGGKVGVDILGGTASDTAVLLAQFVAVVFFMEASKIVLSFDRENNDLVKKSDELSQGLRGKLAQWAQGQLVGQARIMLAGFGLSLALLIVGGLSSVSINQLAFSGALVLVAVGVLLFLLTNRREPERQTRV